MKRQKLIILVLGCLVLLYGCANDQYSIEKEFYYTQKQAKKIFKNPHASPPKELTNAVDILNKFVAKYPKSNLSVEAEFTIARLYIVKEEYIKAHRQLEALLSKYNKSEGVSAETLFLIGNVYEMENKWEEALQKYKRIMRQYPLTPRGFNIPVYIAQHYKIKYQPDMMISAFQEAASHYKALAEKYPRTPFAYNCDRLAIQCYIEIKEWQNAIDVLNSILQNYKSKLTLDGVLMEISAIYAEGLKDKIKAKETLKILIKDYPQSRLTKVALILMKQLDKK